MDVSARLITALALGEFVPGQRLPGEVELGARLEVGRGVVRSAVAELVAGGYLVVQRGRRGGVYVVAEWGVASGDAVRKTLGCGWPELEAALDARALVEGLIARTACERHRRVDVEALSGALAAYVAAEDREASAAADQALHVAIARATRNPQLVALSLSLRAQVSLGFLAEPYSARLRELALDQHARLIAAILDRRVDDADRLAQLHCGLTEQALRDVLDRATAEDLGVEPLPA